MLQILYEVDIFVYFKWFYFVIIFAFFIIQGVKYAILATLELLLLHAWDMLKLLKTFLNFALKNCCLRFYSQATLASLLLKNAVQKQICSEAISQWHIFHN